MTIEQKAKCYDEALKVAKKLYEQGTITESLAYIFPELKESGDEKTRKRIIALVNAHGQGMYKDDMLAWLEKIEKQGEQKPQRMISAEAKEAIYGKPAYAWSEKDEKEYKYVLKFVDNILNNCGNKKDYEHCKRCYDWLKSLRPQLKQEWSEEDEWKFSDILALLRGGENCHYNTPDLFDWLKSLKERMGGLSYGKVQD